MRLDVNVRFLVDVFFREPVDLRDAADLRDALEEDFRDPLDADLRDEDADFFREDEAFLRGTLAPARRASPTQPAASIRHRPNTASILRSPARI